MTITLRKHEIGILILLLTLLNSTKYFPIVVLYLVYKLILRQGRIPVCICPSIRPLFLMISAGIVFASDNSVYEVFKDLWYIIKILLFISVGLIIGFGSPPDPEFLRTTAIYAAVALLVELVLFGLATASGEFARLLPALVPLFILIFYIRSDNKISTKGWGLKWILGALVLAVLFFSESRTSILMAIIVWIGAGGIFRSKTKLVLSGVFLTAAVMITVPLLPQYDPHDVTFLGKIQNSLNELSFVDDSASSSDLTSVTANWRGFEAFRAYDTWRTGSLGQQIFGHGLGATTDIGFYYDLAENYSVRYLPILHNGYFMVLVKYGVLGTALFIGFMALPFYLPKGVIGSQAPLAQDMALTASVLLLVTTAVITGPLNLSKLDGVTLMMGWAIGRQFRLRLAHRMQGRRLEVADETRIQEPCTGHFARGHL